jgi:hypothetical protein
MKAPTQVIVLGNHTIKFYNETNYSSSSTDNIKYYNNAYISGENNSPISQIGIELFEDDALITSCLIGSDGGVTGINENSILISYGGIVVCCGDTVFKLTIPDLSLEWKTVADSASCFGIYYLDQDYVVHGELEITRLDKNGEIIWKYSGGDIWTTENGIDDFAVYDDYILATDWEYYRYKLDFDGKVIGTSNIKTKGKNDF